MGPLLTASRNGHVEVIKELLAHGANVHAWDDYALRYASERSWTDSYALEWRLDSFTDLWTLRKLFTQQLAGVLFSSYLFSITQRTLH
jgi:ankyrin repeat protein